MASCLVLPKLYYHQWPGIPHLAPRTPQRPEELSPCLTGLWSHPHALSATACCIYQCLRLASFSLDQLLLFLSKSLLACHSLQEDLSGILHPWLHFQHLQDLVTFLFLLLQSYSQYFMILITTAIAMVALLVAVPGSISKLPKDRGRASRFSFALVSELFPWKTWRGCPPAASVSHWGQNSLRKENKVGPQWGTNS